MTIYVRFFKIQIWNLRFRKYENKESFFPDCLDYQNSALPNLTKNDVDRSIVTNTKKVGHVYKGFEFLDELEKYLFETISSFTNIDDISDEKLIYIS